MSDSKHTIHSVGETVTKHYGEFRAFVKRAETKTDEGLVLVAQVALVRADRPRLADLGDGRRRHSGNREDILMDPHTAEAVHTYGEKKRETAPVQTHHARYGREDTATIPWDMHMLAYEVYCHVYSPQKAITEDWCRGGFGMQELVAFLFARNFPKEEWRDRVDACYGHMKGF